jgi:hypothetical protein
VTPRHALPLVAVAALLAACGGSSSSTTTSTSDRSAAPPPSASASQHAAGGQQGAGTTVASPPAVTTRTTSPAAAAPQAAAKPGTASAGAGATSPGTYTYDNTGTVTAGTPQDVSGTSTLTVDPPTAAGQHSVLTSDMGRTEQDVVVRRAGTFLTRLVIANPAFTKEFRPPANGLLMPSPATVGRSWSWRATSTDGKTTATVTAKIARMETLTVAGERTPTTVVTSTLALSGDVSYTARMETWYDAAHRLSAKEHTKGSGSYGGFAFTTDITSVLRSTRPS